MITKWILLVLLCALAVPSVSEARGLFRRSSRPTVSTVAAIPAGLSNRTAQGVAEIMAKLNRVGHFGGNPGYEGCGMASTAAQAYAICCYANSGKQTVDVGYARGASGQWFCCRRYK